MKLLSALLAMVTFGPVEPTRIITVKSVVPELAVVLPFTTVGVLEAETCTDGFCSGIGNPSMVRGRFNFPKAAKLAYQVDIDKHLVVAHLGTDGDGNTIITGAVQLAEGPHELRLWIGLRGAGDPIVSFNPASVLAEIRVEAQLP